jgi:hypothetical protein
MLPPSFIKEVVFCGMLSPGFIKEVDVICRLLPSPLVWFSARGVYVRSIAIVESSPPLTIIVFRK